MPHLYINNTTAAITSIQTVNRNTTTIVNNTNTNTTTTINVSYVLFNWSFLELR